MIAESEKLLSIPNSPQTAGVQFSREDLSTEEKYLYGVSESVKDQEIAQQQLQELKRFVKNWQNKPLAQVIEEIASWSLETRRITDPYEFLIDENLDLISPQSGLRIMDVVEAQRFNWILGEQEFKSTSELQQEIKKGRSSQWIWISLPHEGAYEETKLVLSKKIKKDTGQEVLMNWAILLDDFTYPDGLKLATGLNQSSLNPKVFTDADSIRSQIISLDVDDPGLMDLMKKLILDPQLQKAIKQVERGEDVAAKLDALDKAGDIYTKLMEIGKEDDAQEILSKLENVGMVGEHGGSCPKTAEGRSFGSFEAAEREASSRGWTEKAKCKGRCGRVRLVGACGFCVECENG